MKKRYEYSLGAKIKRLQSDADLDENMHFCIRRRQLILDDLITMNIMFNGGHTPVKFNDRLISSVPI